MRRNPYLARRGIARVARTPETILTGIQIVFDPANVVITSGKVETFNGPTAITQSDSTRRATFNAVDANFNGRPSATFAGNDAATAKYYDTTALAGLTAGEVFAVLKCDYDAASGWPSGAYTGLWSLDNNNNTDHYMWTDGHVYDGFGSTARKDYGDTSSLALRSPHIYNVRSAAGSYVADFNGATIFSTATNTVGFPASARFGRSGGGTTAVFNGRLAYLVVCNRVQTPAARAAMTQYLRRKYGTA